MIDETFRTARGPRLVSLFNPVDMVRNLWSRRELIWQFTRRDLAAKYRASYLGMFWTILSPLILLAVYTFIFSVVLTLKWPEAGEQADNPRIFAVTMFIGMLVFSVFADVLNRSTTLVVSHPNFVKKVVFPLEILVPSILLSSIVTMGVGLGVWFVGRVALLGMPTWTALLMPLAVLPVFLMTLGLGWFLASLGVFIRDIALTVAVVTQVLFLLTPIFYSMKMLDKPGVPKWCVVGIRLNPLTPAVEDARRVMLYGTMPDWSWWIPSLVASAVMAVAGYAFFMKSRRAFGDVI